MPLIRGRHSFDNNFTRIPNAWLRDPRISYKAKGLLAELMSHEPGFELSRERLSKRGPDGDRAIRTAIDELEAYGYLSRSQERSERNRFGASIWITQDPISPSVHFAPAGNAPAHNAGAKKTTLKKTSSEKTKDIDFITSEVFESFWSMYPRKVGKGQAEKLFIKLFEKHGEAIIDGVKRLAADPNLPDKQFIPHPTTWLNRCGWLDEPYATRSTGRKLSNAELAMDIVRRYESADGKELTA